MKIKYIYSLEEYERLIIKYINRGCVFRGVNNKSYKLIPGLCRVDENLNKYDKIEYIRNKEAELFEHLKFYSNELSVFKKLSLAQHYGFKTRLLDFTFDPLIALLFAVDKWEESDNNDGDGLEYVIDRVKFCSENKHPTTNKNKLCTY